MKKIAQVLCFLMLCFVPMLCLGQWGKAPEKTALVDTGYDQCIINKGVACEENRNLLFRGDQPLDDKNNYRYDATQLRNLIFSYLQEFKKIYTTKAKLPQSIEELDNYRIVIINLLYDWTDQGSDAEFTELTQEFQYSGASSTLAVPNQHRIYNLTSIFNADRFAFEWWPITLLGKNDIPNNLNWPNQDKVLVPRSSQFYQPMDFPYLISGISYEGQIEHRAADLRTLLQMQPQDGHPLLIFYHCVSGKDRAGYVTMGYFMKQGGYANVVNSSKIAGSTLTRNPPLTFAQALQATTREGYPQPKEEALIAARAYCLTLGKKNNECQ